MPQENKSPVKSELHRIVWEPSQDRNAPFADVRDMMLFSTKLPLSRLQEVQTPEQRQALALEILAAMEQGVTSYGQYVIGLGGDDFVAKKLPTYPFPQAPATAG